MLKYQNVEISKYHTPVLVGKLKELLNLKKGDMAIDATLDGGGHAAMLLQLVGKTGKVLGIEQDAEILKTLKSPKNLIIAEGNFGDIKKLADSHNFKNPQSILYDLGMSTWHLKESLRGFSFEKKTEPLDMRFSKNSRISAAEILNSYKEEELAEIFRSYGELKGARNLARRIHEYRRKKRIVAVGDFLKALRGLPPKILARIFQAIRIFVNDEMKSLKLGLAGGFEILAPSGRIAVISYHSLEDRITKRFFKERGELGEAKIITKKPTKPSSEEIFKNKSARSAKLRVLEKI